MLKDHLALKPDQIAGPLVIAGLAIAAQFIGLDALAFDREAIQGEEYWRLLSAHLVHTNDTHLVMSLAGVLALTGTQPVGAGRSMDFIRRQYDTKV